jgi:ferredoxin
MSWLTGYLLNKITEINSPVWEKSLCLRKISGGNECTVCVDSCPRKALQPIKKLIVLDEDRCSACGFCIQACPTQALGYEDEWFRQQIEELRRANQPVLTCERQPEKGHWKHGCLLGLHPEWLALMALEWGSTSVVLNLSGCESCEYGHHEPGFQESWQEVEQLLCALGKPFSLRQEKDADRIPEITLPEVNRRAWLTSLSLQAREKARETGRELLAGEKRSGFRLREAFQDSLIQHWPLQQDPAYFGGAFLSAFTVTEDCDACGECGRVCRRSAWKMESGGTGALKLTHEAGQCTNCGRCGMHAPGWRSGRWC